MPLDERVQQVVADYLWWVDRAVPDLVEGLYLVGSLALNDFRLRTSNIDFIAGCSRDLDARTIDELRRLHAQVAKRSLGRRFNGPYVTWSQLTADPLQAALRGPGDHRRPPPRPPETPLSVSSAVR